MSRINKGDVYIIKDISGTYHLSQYRSELIGKEVRVISVFEEGERFSTVTAQLCEEIKGHYPEGEVFTFRAELELKK